MMMPLEPGSTGPITVASARNAAYGDSVARILEHTGHTVEREYYFNDSGNQVRELGASVRLAHEGRPLDDAPYRGEYVVELGRAVPPDVVAEANGPDADAAWVYGRWASDRIRAGIEASLARLGVRFDVWRSEGELYRDGAVAAYHNDLGNALQDRGRLSEAIACYRRALRLHPGFAEAWNDLGTARYARGELEAARDRFARARSSWAVGSVRSVPGALRHRRFAPDAFVVCRVEGTGDMRRRSRADSRASRPPSPFVPEGARVRFVAA